MLKRAAVLNALASIAAEFLFALLPLIVLTFVLFFRGEHVFRIMASPEWSFGAAILGGQTLVKFVSGLSRSVRPNWHRVSLAVAALFVLSIVPALTILALVIIAAQSPPPWLVAWQVIMFVVSIAMFVIFGTIGHLWFEHSANGREAIGPHRGGC